jgi:hypothetical protein
VLKSFTITPDLNVTAYEVHKDAVASGHANFASAEEMDALLASLGIKPVDLWNSLPGLTPVKKFMNRRAAIKRIWAQLQGLEATPAAKAVEVVELPKVNEMVEFYPKGTPAQRISKKVFGPLPVAKTAVAPEAGRQPRDGSKEALVVGLLKREGGVTRNEIISATGWIAHSVGGFISGVCKTKLGLPVESYKTEDGQRAYRLTGGE